jgi:hypothetical protein
MRRTHHFIFLFSSLAFISAACGSGSGSGDCPAGEVCTQACPEGEVCTPADGGGGDGSSTTGTDSGGGTTLPAGCTDGGQADPDPGCNACLYAHCCKQVDDCANDPSCQAIINCEAACAPTDESCLLTCSLTADGTTLEAVGNCSNQYCADAGGGCSGSSSLDAGDPFGGN